MFYSNFFKILKLKFCTSADILRREANFTASTFSSKFNALCILWDKSSVVSVLLRLILRLDINSGVERYLCWLEKFYLETFKAVRL